MLIKSVNYFMLKVAFSLTIMLMADIGTQKLQEVALSLKEVLKLPISMIVTGLIMLTSGLKVEDKHL